MPRSIWALWRGLARTCDAKVWILFRSTKFFFHFYLKTYRKGCFFLQNLLFVGLRRSFFIAFRQFWPVAAGVRSFAFHSLPLRFPPKFISQRAVGTITSATALWLVWHRLPYLITYIYKRGGNNDIYKNILSHISGLSKNVPNGSCHDQDDELSELKWFTIPPFRSR